MNAAIYHFAGLRFEPADGRLTDLTAGRQRQLRPQLARLLTALLDQPQTLIDKQQLHAAVWDAGSVVDFEAGLASLLRELRSELKQLGAAGDLIETLPRRGYRCTCPVERASRPGATGHAQRPAAFFRAGRKWLIGLGLALALLISALLALQQMLRPPPPADFGQSLAVLPFAQFGQPKQGPLRLDLLLADQLLVKLWDEQPGGLILIGRASITAYTTGQPEPESLAAVVAEHLGLDLLIEGSIAFEPDRASVSARLLAMPSGRILWSHHLVFDADPLPSTNHIAAMLAESLIAFWQEQQRGP